MKQRISWVVTACNEVEYLQTLLPYLVDIADVDDELIIQLDSSVETSEEMLDLLSKYPWFKMVSFPLRGDDGVPDFSAFKNNLANIVSNDWIFQLDADEIPSKELLDWAHTLPIDNPTVKVFHVPRINEVKGLTRQHISQWNWSVNEQGWVNWPDYQARLYHKSQLWSGKVHETLPTGQALPAIPDLALWHVKDISRQESQNKMYDRIN